MTTTLDMIALNVPLALWEKYEQDIAGGVRSRSVWHSGKNPSKTAKTIHTSLSHPKVVELVAREFDELPPPVRVALMQFCNSDDGSANVHKGVQNLDHKLGGRLLKDQTLQITHRVMGAHGWESRVVNLAKAGAQRKYATYNKKK